MSGGIPWSNVAVLLGCPGILCLTRIITMWIFSRGEESR